MTLTDQDRRIIGLWAASCAERVLVLFEAMQPSDTRPREAIEGVQAYARGERRTARLRTLSWAAHAAAREADDPAAKAAARSACLAAATTYTHALATVHQTRHILGPAVYAALAHEMSGRAQAEGNEIQWAIQHATPPICEITRRFPAHGPGRSRLATLYYQIDTGLREKHMSVEEWREQ